MKKPTHRQLLERLSSLTWLLLDHDGVLTPQKIFMGVIMPRTAADEYDPKKREYAEVVELVQYDHLDARGIDEVRHEAGLSVAIITTQRSGIANARAAKMGIACIQNVNKLEGFKEWHKEHQDVDLDRVCYVGDHASDIPVFKHVGVAECVGDGHPDAKQAAHYVTNSNGGDGAIRELCDLILRSKRKK